ncbi:hypothetical protein [Methylobacter tundripaludum]|uniref:Lipoprotein n=1 Tax=Methylobacter tundripaludum (strain ATCC BAA-1195 / DSM 17260 / SV96) TaxID=697282 RepID=G3IXR2_METTV|nr:hypothetical protein [Methylobacter tundripaludum]EGW23471.1 hypothetical protein Mettu_2327 [Methylobacter tundripaludum SV96]
MKKEIYLAFIICLLFTTNSYAACTCILTISNGLCNNLNEYVKNSADSTLVDSYNNKTCVITKKFHTGGHKLHVSQAPKNDPHITVKNNIANSTFHVFRYKYKQGDQYGSSNKKVETFNIGKYATTRDLM